MKIKWYTTMDSLSHDILAVLIPFSVLFSKPSWQKAITLVFGTLLCTGRRTVCAALRAMGLSEDKGFSRYHHILNRTKWSALEAANILLVMLLTFIPDESPLVIFVDETLEHGSLASHEHRSINDTRKNH